MAIVSFPVIAFLMASAVLGVAISYGKLYLFHLAATIFVGQYLLQKVINKDETASGSRAALPPIFLGMLIWYSLSLIWSINRQYTLEYLFYLGCGITTILGFTAYVESKESLNRIFSVLKVVFIIEAILSLLEVATPFRLPVSPFSSYLAYFGREATLQDNDIFLNNIAYFQSMPTGFQWNPNNLAITMVLILPFFLFYAKRHVKVLGSVLILALVVAAGSRGVFLSYIVTIGVWLILSSPKQLLLRLVALLPLFAIGFVGFNLLVESENKAVMEISSSFDAVSRYLFEVSESNDSIGVRQQLAKNGIDALIESSGLGVGGGCSKAVQEVFGGVAGRYTSLHNFWLELFVDGGVVFGAAFLFWYLLTVYKLFLLSKSAEDTTIRYYASSLTASFIGFFVAAVSASSVIYVLPMWLMYGFAVSTIHLGKQSRLVSSSAAQSRAMSPTL